jgi:hypothetical protein
MAIFVTAQSGECVEVIETVFKPKVDVEFDEIIISKSPKTSPKSTSDIQNIKTVYPFSCDVSVVGAFVSAVLKESNVLSTRRSVNHFGQSFDPSLVLSKDCRLSFSVSLEGALPTESLWPSAMGSKNESIVFKLLRDSAEEIGDSAEEMTLADLLPEFKYKNMYTYDGCEIASLHELLGAFSENSKNS